MQFQFGIIPSATTPVPPLVPLPDAVPDLLKMIIQQQSDLLTQMLEVQREQLHFQRAKAHDAIARWRQVLGRWEKDYPELAEHSKTAYPLVERAFIQMLSVMLAEVSEQGEDALDNEFAVQEFIDRYGMKIGQLGQLLSVMGPLNEAAQQNEAAKQQQQQAPPT
jgi:hypothetical protein